MASKCGSAKRETFIFICILFAFSFHRLSPCFARSVHSCMPFRILISSFPACTLRFDGCTHLVSALPLPPVFPSLPIYFSSLIRNHPVHFIMFSGRCGHGSPCEQLCYELHDGMYECDCSEGFELNKNGYSCQGKSPSTRQPFHQSQNSTFTHVSTPSPQ